MVWPYKYAYDIPLVVLIINYIWVYGFSSFLSSGKYITFGFAWIQKVVWPYRHIHHVPLVTMILKIYGFVCLSSGMNQGQTDRLTIHTL